MATRLYLPSSGSSPLPSLAVPGDAGRHDGGREGGQVRRMTTQTHSRTAVPDPLTRAGEICATPPHNRLDRILAREQLKLRTRKRKGAK